MIIKKQYKLSPKKISGLLTSLIILISLIIVILTSLFLYNNFYQTITQTREILILKEKVALDTVDMEKFDLIMDKLSKKTSVKELINVASPFD